MDPDSLTEAVIAGPSSAGEEALKRAAMDKLRYILAKDTNS
ncbi:MAG: hypothetical protein U9N14_03885 [Pseudomonadota bacterium]|nr:hypothetical protein [Pseudomonadota bacterium]